MNLAHRCICQSDKWAARMRSQVLPWACEDVPLDGNVLEIGPGYGLTTRWLLERCSRLTVLEVDANLAAGLRRAFVNRVEVQVGDGAAMAFPDETFDTVVCFTMLHHMPSPQRQDRLFAEAARVLRPAGTFAGSDSRPSLRMRLLHIGDTMVTFDPVTLPDRLLTAGLVNPNVDLGGHSLRFRATRPLMSTPTPTM